jgi:hypothetical protein
MSTALAGYYVRMLTSARRFATRRSHLFRLRRPRSTATVPDSSISALIA